MRVSIALLTGLIVMGLSSCSKETKEHGERQAGKAAYHVSQGAKTVLETAGHELRIAGQQAHAGWKQANRESRDKRK